MGWWHNGWGFGLGGWESILIGGLMMLLMWGGLFILLFFVIRAASSDRRDRGGEGSDQRALAILDQRYAKGEIGAEEYREMKKTLQS